jgi:hypothetical protein
MNQCETEVLQAGTPNKAFVLPSSFRMSYCALQSQIRRKSEETMRKAYLGARAEIRETHKADETWRAGSVSVLVTNTGELVTASMGNYRAVVCRAAVAHEIGSRDQQSAKRYWSRRLISGMEHFPTLSVLL